MNSKKCSQCYIEKTVDQYNKATNGCLFDVASVCKQCMVINRKQKRLEKNEGLFCEYPPSKYKKCIICKTEKENIEKYFRWVSKVKKRSPEEQKEVHPHSLFQNECKACELQRQKERSKTPECKARNKKNRDKNRDIIRARDRKARQEKLKDPEYAKQASEKNKKRYYENHAKSLDIAKRYREKNIEKTRESSRKYYWANRERVTKRASAWRRNTKYSSSRRKRDHIYKIKCECRGRINWLTRRRTKVVDYKKTCPQTEKLIGCTVEFYYQHIEKQFTENMSWHNHGEWHIDHIIPLAVAKTKEAVLALNKWSNLQPLWLSDNIKKGAKIPESSLYDYFTNEISEEDLLLD
jgi:hypothetical protein